MTTPSRKRKRARTPAYRAKRQSTMKVLEKKVNRLVRVKETKGTEAGEALGLTDALPNCVGVQLFDPAQGDTVAARDGDKIQPVSCRMTMKLHAGSSINDNIVQFARIVILRDTCGGATAPSATDIWGGSTTDITQSFDRSNRRKWDILYDKTVSISQVPSSSGNGTAIIDTRFPRSMLLEINPKVTGRPIYFTAGATTYDRGGLWLYVKGESQTDPITFQCLWSALFKD